MKHMTSLEVIKDIKIKEDRLMHSSNHEEILSGLTTDVYFLRTLDILKYMNLDTEIVTAEIFARKPGVFVGIEEVKNMLKDKDVEVWAPISAFCGKVSLENKARLKPVVKNGVKESSGN